MMEQVINNEERLKEWVPSRTPLRWFLINQCLLFYSMIQFSIIIMTIHNTGAKPSVAASYLIWNFGTTIIWCFEAGLELWWIIRTISISRKDLLSIQVLINIGEMIIAVYYLIDSISLLYHWESRSDSIQWSLLDVGLNAGFYFYASLRDFIRILILETTLHSLQDDPIDSNYSEIA